MSEEKTIFQKIIDGEIPCHKLYEDEYTFAFLDINPNTRGHSLVVPKKLSRNIYEVDDETAGHLMITVKKVAQALKDELEADGMNVVINNEKTAGQIIFHTHVHVIPRYKGDRGYLGQKYQYEESELEEISKLVSKKLEN